MSTREGTNKKTKEIGCCYWRTPPHLATIGADHPTALASSTSYMSFCLELHKFGVPPNLFEASKELSLLPAANAPCSLFQQRAETSFRKLLDELAEQHEAQVIMGLERYPV